MEGFEYKDIFATKALEYIVILGFLVLLILYFRLLNKQAKGAKSNQPAEARGVPITDFFTTTAGYYYHLGHAWIKVEKDESVWAGIDDFARKLLGKIDGLVLPEPGTRLIQGESGWKIKLAGQEIDILSPVTGEVKEVNENLRARPGDLNPDNFAYSWFLKVEVPKLDSTLNNLFSGNMAAAWLNETIKQLQRAIPEHKRDQFSDDQIAQRGFARLIGESEWLPVAEKFLKPARR
jgi:glycine cleavage system H lipoate-binding protein